MKFGQSKPIRIGIVGSGFSGGILARQLLRHDVNVEVTVFEKTQRRQVSNHWTQPVTGAGLNINSNAMAMLKQIDRELYEKFYVIGADREYVSSVTVEGEILYSINIVEDGLADVSGCRVRWDDANTLVRGCLGNSIIYDAEVTRCLIEEDGSISISFVKNDGFLSERNFDLLIACDGRYSSIRSTMVGVPETIFGGVCNFRILLPNCHLDGSPFDAFQDGSVFFDDLQLFYNVTPSVENLNKDSILRYDAMFTECVLRSNVRVGIMRIPASNFRHEVGESLYLFGNFAIPIGEDIPESAKTAEALYCLLSPAGGDISMTEEAKYIRDAVSGNADKLHWSRFQHTPVIYHDDKKKILFLGDASHGFCPALGQGATLAIEDACLAAHVLLSSIRENESLSVALEKISEYQMERAMTIRDMSNEAAEHILFEEGESDGMSALIKDSIAWTGKDSMSLWRDKVSDMWMGYPKIQDLNRKTWLQVELEAHSTDQFYPEFDEFLSSHLVCAVVALAQLGGDRRQVRRFLDCYTRKLEPGLNALGKIPEEANPSAKTLTDLLGERKQYYRIRQLYYDELEALDGDIDRLLRKSFPILSSGMAGSLLHGLINLGYSICSGSNKMIVEQLSYLHYTNKPIIHSKNEERDGLQHFGKGSLSFMDSLALLKQNKDLYIQLQKTREMEMRSEKEGWVSSTPQYRIAAMLEVGDMLLSYVDKVQVPGLCEIEADEVDVTALAKWTLDQAIKIYALCENKNEFVFIHGVTASWALCQIIPLLDKADALVSIRHMLCVLFVIYIVQDCPEFHSVIPEDSIFTLDDWDRVCERALANEEDIHIGKVVAVCRERWFEIRDKASCEARLCQLAVQVALDNPIHWHQYDFPDGFDVDDLIGVSGIRDNTF